MADDKAMVSIVMPCCGQLEYTRMSVPRVLRHSRPPFEVLFIDAGSLDGTSEYLDGVAAAAPVRVEVLRESRESAFGELVAEALARARGAFVAWLGNDVLVGDFWLQQLVALAASNEVIGGVSPMANLAPEPLRVENVPYRLRRPRPAAARDESGGNAEESEAVDAFARQHRDRNKGGWAELERLGGFCWLVKRKVLSQVELFEKKAEEGVVDMGKFSSRIRRAGYRLAGCKDMYVHHFGSNLMNE
jgi:O-antigen biosynthesis protein